MNKYSLKNKLMFLILGTALPFACITAYLIFSLRNYSRAYDKIVSNMTIANSYNLNFKEEMDESLYKLVVSNVTFDTVDEDGTLKNFAKARGTKRALNSLVDYYEAAGDKKPGERVYILHADSQENAEYLEEKVKQINPQCSVTKMMLSPIIGAHTGPGMCAVVHFGRR